MKKLLLFFCSAIALASAVHAEEDAPARKPIRVYVDVVGDLTHFGHVNFFRQAKALGDYLIVGVLSDADVASYKRWPIMTLEERVAAIQGCRYVDEVIAAPPIRLTEEWIREHEIDLVVHGDDFNPDTMRYWYGVSMDLGIFRSVPYTKGVSTSNIIQRIVDRYNQQQKEQQAQ
jgi:cytidyltransferase-like protein